MIWPFHRHVWRIEAVQVEAFRSGDETNILLRCGCGKAKVDNVQGAWTIEQLRGCA